MLKSEMKPPKTYDEQLDILISRGLIIRNLAFGKNVLRCTNYYRLSGYALFFKSDDDNFIDGTSIEDVYELYLFDEELRHRLFEIIEPIEIRLRSEMAYILSLKYNNPLVYMEPSICSADKTITFARHLSDHYEEISKSVKQPFVCHNLSKYGGLPIWAAVELWSFGHLSSYLDTLCTEAKAEIAASFNTDVSRIGGWFHNLSTVRNICAHSGRIYDRDINIGVKLYPEDAAQICTPRRLMNSLIVIKRIYSNKGKWLDFANEIYTLIQRYSSVVDIAALGFPKYWYNALTDQRKVTNSKADTECT